MTSVDGERWAVIVYDGAGDEVYRLTCSARATCWYEVERQLRGGAVRIVVERQEPQP